MSPTSVKRWFRRNLWAVLGSLVAAAGLFWLLQQGALPVLPNADALANMSWPTLPAYVALYVLALCVRGGRWYFLIAPLHEVKLSRILTISFVFYGASVALPFRMGEAVRPALIREKGKLSAWAAAGTVAAERVVDGLFVSAILLLALALATPISPLPERIGELPVPTRLVPDAAYAAAWLFIAAFLVILAFYLWRGAARTVTERALGLVSPSLGRFVAQKVELLANGLEFLPKLRYSLPFILVTALYWMLNAYGFLVLLRGVGLTGAGLAEASVVMGVLALGLLVPNAPGFFGTFQISVYSGLAMYMSADDIATMGSVFVFWLYTIQIGLCLLMGFGASLLELRSSQRRADPAS